MTRPATASRRAGYRITPGCAPPAIVGKRRAALGYPREIAETGRFIDAMRHLMNDAMMDGKRILFNDPEEIAKPVGAAKPGVPATPGAVSR